MDLPTRTELFDAAAREVIARSEARAPGKRIAREAIYTEGSDINVLLAGASAMAEEVLRQHARSEADKYLDSARGDGLDRHILDRVSRELPRKTASPAFVTLVFSRTEGDLAAINLGARKRVSTRSQVAFELMTPVSFGAGELGPLTARARAVLAGSPGNVDRETLTEIEDSPDPALVVTNPDRAAGGYDRERDPSYRERGRSYFLAARRGVISAIELGAKTAPGVAFATVEEQLDEFGDPTGFVFVYIVDVTGQANQILVDNTKQHLRDYRCTGIPPFVVGAVPEYVEIAYRLRFVAGTDPEHAFKQLRFATVALVNQTAPNRPLEASLLLALARRVPGLIVRDDALVNPPGDLYPSASGRVLRTTPDRVHLVAP